MELGPIANAQQGWTESQYEALFHEAVAFEPALYRNDILPDCTAVSLANAMGLVAAVALLMIMFWARIFALRVQDRVIRLEMHLRILSLAPDLSPRFGEFTLGQLCALRFASDAELPELARKVLAEKLGDRTAIKKMVRDWQADHARA